MAFELNPPTVLVLMLGIAGITAAIMAFIKTPPDRRFRVRPKTLEEQRAACPPEVQAVIIKGDWRKALRREAWWLPVLLPMLAFALWLDWTEEQQCAALFGFSRTRIIFYGMAYGTSFMVLASLVAGIKNGIPLIRGGYWPPLDSCQFVDTLAKKGRWMRLRGWAMCLLPFVFVGWLIYSFVQVNEWMGEHTLQSMIEKIEADCPSAQPPK